MPTGGRSRKGPDILQILSTPPGPTEDRPAEREGGLSLRIVQSGENALDIGHLAEASTGPRRASGFDHWSVFTATQGPRRRRL